MFGISNPYHSVVRALDEAISACHRAMGEMDRIPHGKGRGEFGSSTYTLNSSLKKPLPARASGKTATTITFKVAAGLISDDVSCN